MSFVCKRKKLLSLRIFDFEAFSNDRSFDDMYSCLELRQSKLIGRKKLTVLEFPSRWLSYFQLKIGAGS